MRKMIFTILSAAALTLRLEYTRLGTPTLKIGSLYPTVELQAKNLSIGTLF